MTLKIIVPLGILLIILSAGIYITSQEGGSTMAMTHDQEGAAKNIPPMDINIPAVTETATFALG